MLETDLYQLISQDPGVLAAADNANSTYLGAIPKGQPDSPAVVIQVTHTDRVTGAEGPNALLMKRVQFDSYDASYPDCVALSNAVLAAVIKLRGVALASTQIQGTIPQRDMDMGQEPSDVSTTGYTFRRLIEVDFFHTELS